MTAAETMQRYTDAMDRRAALIAEWERLERPMLCDGGATGKAIVPHPLIAMIQAADMLCDRLGKSVRQRDVGRPTGSSSAPDRQGPPRVTLKVVDG